MRYINVIDINSDTSHFYVDLRNLAVSSTLTGVLLDTMNQEKVNESLTFTFNDRAYKFNSSFFVGIQDGQYKLNIVNDSEDVIYSERVNIERNNAYQFTQNSQTISIIQNEPS